MITSHATILRARGVFRQAICLRLLTASLSHLVSRKSLVGLLRLPIRASCHAKPEWHEDRSPDFDSN
jgi:hypothetical protein